MSQELTDVEFLRMLAQHGDDNPYSGTIGIEDRARLRSIAAKLERPAVLAKLDERCGGWKLDWDLLPTEVLREHMGVEPVDEQFVKVTIHPV